MPTRMSWRPGREAPTLYPYPAEHPDARPEPAPAPPAAPPAPDAQSLTQAGRVMRTMAS
jgi:hypothetical protein